MRLIDADEMSKRYTHYGISHPYDAVDLDDMLAEMPTVEAIPLEWLPKGASIADSAQVVRCRDCEHFMEHNDGQEPRVMKFSEIMVIYNADPFHVWPYNTPPYLYIQEHPHVRHSSESWAAWREIKDIIEGELFGHTAKSYGVTWRCWNRKPTNELREAVKWE